MIDHYPSTLAERAAELADLKGRVTLPTPDEIAAGMAKFRAANKPPEPATVRSVVRRERCSRIREE